MKGRRRNLTTTEKAILAALIAGAVILSPMGHKVVLALAKYYLKKWWDAGGPYVPPEKDPEQVRDSLHRLKRRGYVEWRYDKNKKVIELKLTKEGKKFFGECRYEDVAIPTPEVWDGKWRLFMFDIPEKSRSFRNALRDKLKRLGFFKVQKSVWVYPFECEKEIGYICDFFGIRHFTLMFRVKIDQDSILRKYFLNQGILLNEHMRANAHEV